MAVPPRAERRVALWSIFGFWAFYFVLNTTRQFINGEGNHLEQLPKRGGVVLIGIAITFIMYVILRRLEGRSMRVMLTTAFLVSVPAAIAYAAVNYAAFYLVAPRAMLMQEAAQLHSKHLAVWDLIGDSAVSWYFFIAAWGVLYVALSYAAKMGHAERSAAIYRSQAQAAQLRALRYQINPHFLFNTLTSISSLIRSKPETARMLIVKLSGLLRRLLRSQEHFVTLREELEAIDEYLDIESIRFGPRLHVEKDIDDASLEVVVPSMLLQPLVENSIKHGLSPKIGEGRITIRSVLKDGHAIIDVIDNGVGVGPAHAERIKAGGIGLRNVNERLRVIYGANYQLQLDSVPGEGTCARIVIPELVVPARISA